MESVFDKGTDKFWNVTIKGLAVPMIQLKLTTRLQGGGTTIVLQISLTHGGAPGGVNFFTLKQTLYVPALA